MKSLILIISFVYFLIEVPETLVIDITKIDQPNVSEIAENIIAIPIKNINSSYFGVVKVCLFNENIFLLLHYWKDGGPCTHLFKYDISGNYIEQIGLKNNVTNDFESIRDMDYDNTQNTLYLKYNDGYRVYDSDGKFLSFIPQSQVQPQFIFHERFWTVDYSENSRITDYSLVHTDLYGQNKDTVTNIKYKLPDGLLGISYALPNFSIKSNELYVSFKIDNTIYKVDQYVIEPCYTFEFKNHSPSDFKILNAPKQLVIGHYIKYGYMMPGLVEYDFLYDTRTGKSYNIKYLHKSNTNYSSGIKDDIYDTGFFNIRPTNTEDYIYFYKKSEDLKTSKLYDPKQENPFIFLVKLK